MLLVERKLKGIFRKTSRTLWNDLNQSVNEGTPISIDNPL
jgi:hypothetical protein